MIKALLFIALISGCPDISEVTDEQVELHPVLGMVITLNSGVSVAFPLYPPTYVEQCDFFVERDTFNLTFKICYGRILYILGEPTMFKSVGSNEWLSMDYYKCDRKEVR